MKLLLRLLPLVLVLSAAARASSDEDFAAVKRADQRRIVATIAGDAKLLGDLLSDDLLYAQADGRLQSKEQLLAAVRTNDVHYLAVKPSELQFQAVAAGAVTMTGHADIEVEYGGRTGHLLIHFLAVWRNESGQWRLLAYQSGPLPSGAAAGNPR